MAMIDETRFDLARRAIERAAQKLQLGDLDSAIALYQDAIRLHPTAEAHTLLAQAYGALGLYEDAIEEGMRAIALDPDYGNPYNDIGAYLMAMDCWEAALEWLEKALHAPRSEHPAYPYMNLARVYLHFKQEIRALRAFRNAWEAENYLPALDAYEELAGKLN
jgi:Tfp pilus assembly protein PilF